MTTTNPGWPLVARSLPGGRPPLAPTQRLLVLTLVLTVAAPSSLLAAPSATPAPRPDAEVVSVAGKAWHARAVSSEDWLAASVGLGLNAGQRVRTEELSTMGLLLADQTQLRLDALTDLVIRTVRRAGSATSSSLLLRLGRAWSRSKTNPDGLRVETPSAVASIRGTEWVLSVDEAGTSSLAVLRGEVELGNQHGSVTVRANEQARAEVGKAPVKLVLSSAADRVQWVTAHAVDPLRHVGLHPDPSEPLEPLASGAALSLDEWLLRGRLLADRSRWDEADAAFAAVLARRPFEPAALIGRAFAALRSGDVDAAAGFLDRAGTPRASRDEELLRLAEVSVALLSQDLASAAAQLESLAQRRVAHQPAAWLLRSDLDVQRGRLTDALRRVEEGLVRFPDNARLHAQAARVLTLAGRLAEAGEAARRAAIDPSSLDARLVRGELARLDGDAARAKRSFEQAIDLNDFDDRGHHGLGRVQAEREEVVPGLANLRRAIELNPDAPGTWGELGTLLTLANEIEQAEDAFAQALERTPDDYVALTGRGLLKLKQGEHESALEDLLKASLLEPRYARAHVHAAVARYQAEDFAEALKELRIASEIDDKDPLPHFMAAMMHVDLFEPYRAIEEGRVALQKMPNLKSLNQLLSDQRGSANIGNAFGFFGLEAWAQHHAQESYSPHWAGSHFFLAERYEGEVLQASELFQGLVTDPTSFGASQRYQDLTERPGHHGRLGLQGSRDDELSTGGPRLVFNGLAGREVPTAWFAELQHDRLSPRDRFIDGDADTATLALGIEPTHAVGLFVLASGNRLEYDWGAEREELPGNRLRVAMTGRSRDRTDRIELGLRVALSAASQLWFRHGGESQRIDGPLTLPDDPMLGTTFAGDGSSTLRDTNESTALRHGVVFRDRHELAWGLERGTSRLSSVLALPALGVDENLILTALEEAESRVAFLSGRVRPSAGWLFQADLWLTDYEQHDATQRCFPAGSCDPSITEDVDFDRLSPRIGLAADLGEHALLRLAWQDWVRPVTPVTLGPVATAGIPLEDRFARQGGRTKRARAQLEWEPSPRLFGALFVEHVTIENLDVERRGTFPTPSTVAEDLERLRNRVLINLANEDLLEDVSRFSTGRVEAAGFTVEALLDERWSAWLRYVRTRTENTDFEPDSNGDVTAGNELPYLPRHLAALGVTWVSPEPRLQLAARATYRSARFEDDRNLVARDAGWAVDLNLFWESRDKRWFLNALIRELLNDDASTRYALELAYRY
ncbi:MAG: TonB-dependent receptor [Acidobacteriota bacterium]